MSQVSCGHIVFFQPLIDRIGKLVESFAQSRPQSGFVGNDLGQLAEFLAPPPSSTCQRHPHHLLRRSKRNKDYRAALFGAKKSDPIEARAGARYALSEQPAPELLGGMAFICSSEVGYLLAATTALVFHPPPRLSLTDALDAYLSDQRLNIN